MGCERLPGSLNGSCWGGLLAGNADGGDIGELRRLTSLDRKIFEGMDERRHAVWSPGLRPGRLIWPVDARGAVDRLVWECRPSLRPARPSPPRQRHHSPRPRPHPRRPASRRPQRPGPHSSGSSRRAAQQRQPGRRNNPTLLPPQQPALRPHSPAVDHPQPVPDRQRLAPGRHSPPGAPHQLSGNTACPPTAAATPGCGCCTLPPPRCCSRNTGRSPRRLSPGPGALLLTRQRFPKPMPP